MYVENFRFKKAFGQNFLKDDNIVKKIVNTAMLKEKSLVIEVGPGSGMLTRELCKKADQVLAYEIDLGLEDILAKGLSDYKNVDVIFDDFLSRDVKEDISKYEYDYLYLVANLPYYITTPIITKLITSNVDISKAVIMVQKEVGDRFGASTNSREYGSLTVFLNYYFDIKKEFIVKRTSFVPMPNVDSMIVSLTKKEEIVRSCNEDLFFKLVKDSFKFKRKNIRNNLKDYDLEIVSKVLAKYSFDLTARAEQLPLEVFIDLSNSL